MVVPCLFCSKTQHYPRRQAPRLIMLPDCSKPDWLSWVIRLDSWSVDRLLKSYWLKMDFKVCSEDLLTLELLFCDAQNVF